MLTILLLLDKAVPSRDTGDIATLIAGVPTMTEHNTELPFQRAAVDHARD